MTILAESASSWRPILPQSDAPLHLRLSDALSRDIAAGVLPVGARLPTHRDLAYALKVGVGTVTRAYAEAEARGLIAGQVGRGSFVVGRPAVAVAGPVDLAHNLPPGEPAERAERRFKEALARVSRRADLYENLGYAPPAGLESHRRAGTAWLLRSSGLANLDWRRLLVCPGAQVATSLTLARLCRPGDTLLAEAGSYFVTRTLADYAGYRMRGVAMDGEGLDPEALERAVLATGARVLYTIPTLQNPTGRSMGRARRAEIVRIARAHDLWILEDDVYAACVVQPLPPLAALAPERTFYIGGLSKILAPGLRTSYLVAPDIAEAEALARGVRALTYSPPTFGSLIATQWIEDGTADTLAQEVRAEIDARRKLAFQLLGDALELGAGGAPHVWAPMSELAAERLAGRCLREGVELTPPSAPIIEPSLISGVRLCLGAPRDRATLERALGVVASALRNDAAVGASGVL
jgi:DNA-binding transcriptional MocR family regulator